MKKKPNGYRYFCHLTGCLFGIFILAVLIINFLVPDRGFSQKENRVLASRPAISVSQLTSGKFADGYETYVNDQFFLRDWWITLRATAQRILGWKRRLSWQKRLPDGGFYSTLPGASEPYRKRYDRFCSKAF